MVEEASEQAVAAFAPDVVIHMIETLCGGEPATVTRVARRVEAMTGQLDAFQIRPEIEDLLKRLKRAAAWFWVRWSRVGSGWSVAGIAHLFTLIYDAAGRMHLGRRPNRRRHRACQSRRHGDIFSSARALAPSAAALGAETPDAVVD